ncbi:MAG: double-stranded DNA-binding protein [Candidatus Nitrosocaldus sp.]
MSSSNTGEDASSKHSDDSGYDPAEQIIMVKKLLDMKRRMLEQRQKSDREILLEHLTDRGEEVLEAAEQQYPREMRFIVPKFASLIKSGEVKGMITGADLLAILRSVGLNVRLDSRIMIEKDGRLISLAERLKSSDDGK